MKVQSLDDLSSKQEWMILITLVLGFWIFREAFFLFIVGWFLGTCTLHHEDEIDGQKITENEYDWARREIRKLRGFGDYLDKFGEHVRHLMKTEREED